MRSSVMVVMLAALVLAAGCGRKSATRDDAAAAAGTQVPAAAAEQAGATTAGAGGEDVAEARPLDDAGGAGAGGAAAADTVIYFDFDRSELRAEYGPVIATHARRLASNPALKVRLEGNTDERGSREYNIALGERRAQSVRRALQLQGAGEAQLSTVSYGEERPAAEGSDETAYARNRRVEIIFSTP